MKEGLTVNVSVITSWTMKDWTPEKIKRLRKAAGMTQARFAEWLGVTRVHVTHLESGFRSAGPQTARLLEVLWRRVESDTGKTVQPSRKRGKQ